MEKMNNMDITKKSLRYLSVFLMVLVGMVVLSASAFSQGNIKLGNLSVSPSFTERINTDDNIYQISGKGSTGHKNSDIINTYTPGLGLTLPIGAGQITGKHALGLDWRSDFKNYMHNADQNQQNHFLNGSANFEFARGLSVSLVDQYVDTVGAAGSDTDRLHPRRTNTGSIAVSLPDYFRKIDVDVTYENFNQDYDERALRRANRNRHKFTVKVPFQLTPKISLFPEYSYDATHMKNENISGALSDSHASSFYVGTEWQATAKTSGIMKFGFVNRDFEKATVSDISTFAMLIGVKADLSERTKFTLDITRTDQISEFTSGSNGYVATGGKFNLSHTIRKLTAALNGGYQKSVFRDSTRKDDAYDAGASLKYAIKEWSFVDFAYSHRDRRSNFEAQSDRINKLSIGVGFNF